MLASGLRIALLAVIAPPLACAGKPDVRSPPKRRVERTQRARPREASPRRHAPPPARRIAAKPRPGVVLLPRRPKAGDYVSLRITMDPGRGCGVRRELRTLGLNGRAFRHPYPKAGGTCANQQPLQTFLLRLGHLAPGTYRVSNLLVTGSSALTFRFSVLPGPKRLAPRPPPARLVPASPRVGDRVTLVFQVHQGSGCGVRFARRTLRVDGRQVTYRHPYGHGLCDAFFGSTTIRVDLGRLLRGRHTVTGLPGGSFTFRVR